MELKYISKKPHKYLKTGFGFFVFQKRKMAKKCIYCGSEISQESVIDFCERCGIRSFGKKLFDTIKTNMENARENGDLCHSRTNLDNSTNKFS